MLKNYFKIACRSFARNKSFTIINVLGLGVGIAVCLFIFLVVEFETSFDNFHSKKERIYRVLTEFKDPSGISHSSGVPSPLPAALKQDFPQLEKVTEIVSDNNTQLSIMDNSNQQAVKKFKEQDGVFFTDADFSKSLILSGCTEMLIMHFVIQTLLYLLKN